MKAEKGKSILITRNRHKNEEYVIDMNEEEQWDGFPKAQHFRYTVALWCIH